MRTSPTGQSVLLVREGVKTRAYRDSVGVWTIGGGHTSAAGPPKVVPGMTITMAQAKEIFARDLVQYERAVENAVTRELMQNEFDALVSVCYNIGTGAFKKSTIVKRLNAGRAPEEVAAAIMMWTKPAEITSRRQAEADQYLTPYDVASPKARSSDRARVTEKRRIVAQNPDPVASSLVTLASLPDAGAHPVTVSQQDPDMIAPTKPLSGLWSLFQGKPPVPRGDRKEVVEQAKEEAPSLMKDLGGLRTVGLLGGAGSLLGGAQDSGLLDSIKSSADGATETFQSVQSLVNIILSAVKWGVSHWWLFGLALTLYVLVKVGWAIFKVYVYVRNNVKSSGD
jgi:lysozyme